MGNGKGGNEEMVGRRHIDQNYMLHARTLQPTAHIHKGSCTCVPYTLPQTDS